MKVYRPSQGTELFTCLISFCQILYFRPCAPKSPYNLFRRYRCHHNTRYEATKDTSSLLTEKPSKRMKNTSCPFSMTIKLDKSASSHTCAITIEWFHNHPLKSLQVNSFKDILTETAQKVKDFFDRGFSPGM